MSFEDALRENRVPPLLGDVRLFYDGGRLVGESLPPPWTLRVLPSLCLGLAGVSAALGTVMLVLDSSRVPGVAATLPLVLAGALVFGALVLEARLKRRRFVLHFKTESLRLETLAWAPGAARTETLPFDDVRAVHIVQPPGGRYSLVVEYGPLEAPRRALLVRDVRPQEGETLHRVWRLLHNAFGLKGAGLAGR
ncbi:hypothetical protein D7Y13_30440 [Corallococcus praedator]|uniref:DUF2244 domain-containing protein n=1 Tax=Corallococcus praedator TaxID=2316724 RepID=A0ABX9Q9K2_9BACT|nr:MULTISPECIES: hypothetical protein [Corallococcus]RKH19996.1 hypothetical protein D7X74_05275 [Corallococcus sp. CA047B]RKH34503.1 hypothetical protein D7X75_07995 [Corallococcus sp. CA031C]RKH96856.1 hypothetical protein D7Y13_30440 [Corallococcus praedator]